MCTGAEVLTAAQIFGAVTGGISAINALTAKKPGVVSADPVAQDQAAQTQAAQEAQAKALDLKRKQRANSLLSQAGAAGDLTDADVSKPGAKATLGQ